MSLYYITENKGGTAETFFAPGLTETEPGVFLCPGAARKSKDDAGGPGVQPAVYDKAGRAERSKYEQQTAGDQRTRHADAAGGGESRQTE